MRYGSQFYWAINHKVRLGRTEGQDPIVYPHMRVARRSLQNVLQA